MADLLAKMDEQKRMRLINAGMKVFAEHSFEKASTNTIVKEAGISKGLLYHYFDTKEALFEYLIEFSVKAMALPATEEIGYGEKDILKRIRAIARFELATMKKYPAMLEFIKNAYRYHTFEEMMTSITKHYPVPLEMIYKHNIDESLFKEGVNIPLAITTIQWTVEKIAEACTLKWAQGIHVDLEDVFVEVDVYLDHFRQVYYNNER